MKTIGFIGLGHMGFPMVQNLLKYNYTVIVYDISPEAIAHAVAAGATAADNVADLTQKSDIVFTMLQTGEQVKKVCLGDQGIFSNINKEGLYIDSSSIDIHSSRELHAAAKSHDIAMIDAPVSGGVAAAGAGTLTFMVGGEEKDFEQSKKILSVLGKKIIYAGSAGTGVAAKMCNNMLLGISMIGVSEAFILADQLGLSPQKLFEISNNASGQCWSLTQYCPWPGILPNAPASHHYQPGFTAKMMLKDLALSQDAAKTAAVTTPLGKHAMELYEKFSEASPEMDFSGIVQYLKKGESA